MKLYKKLLLPAVALLAIGGFSACSEDDTLEGADAVYIEMEPSEITLALGDTVKIGAKVTNVSGHVIDTPISWSVDRAEGEPEIVRLLGDTAIVSVEGAIGRSTNLRATLKNGKYALATVNVIANTPDGVMPIDTAGVYAPRRTSYNIGHDSVVFKVTPKLLLRDYTPTYTLEGEGIEPYGADPMYIDYEKGTVAIHYSAARKAGIGSTSVSIGTGATAKTGECVIRMDAPVEGASFYGPDYAGMPYIESRPPLHTIEQYWANVFEHNMDVNAFDTCRVAVNVQTGAEVDILEAYKGCEWTCLEGSSVMVVNMYNEYVEGHGFDAVLVVASGINRGSTLFRFTTPKDTLSATFNVFNLTADFPVDEITVDQEEIELFSGQTVLLTTGVVPMSSYAYHKPKVTASDPSVIQVGNYIGNQVPLTGLKEGETYLTLTSNGVTKTVHVTVIEGVRQVLWGETSSIIFAGESTNWTVNVVTPSGAANQFPVEWSTTDEEVATAVAVEGDLNAGTVTGVAKGQAGIRAKVLNQQSDERTVRVISAPQQGMSFSAGDLIECYGDGSSYVIYAECGDDALYKYVTITLADVYEDTLFGSFTPGEGSTIELDGRKVNVTGGSITMTEGSGADSGILNGTITFEVEGMGTYSFSFNNLEVTAY